MFLELGRGVVSRVLQELCVIYAQFWDGRMLVELRALDPVEYYLSCIS